MSMIEASEILATSEFTTTVTLPSGSTVEGIFDNKTDSVGIGIGIEAAGPQVAVADAVADALSEGSRLTISGTVYKCKSPFEKDGAGITRIHLEA